MNRKRMITMREGKEVNLYKTYEKRTAVNNAVELEFMDEDEAEIIKCILDEYYSDDKGLLQFVYDYLRNRGDRFVQVDKEELKKAFCAMVDDNYYFIERR